MPLPLGEMPELQKFTRIFRVVLLLDHEAQLNALKGYDFAWDIFVKIDVGSKRAGLPLDSPRLKQFLDRAVKSKHVNITGLYSHVRESYDCTTPDEACDVLHQELNSLLKASELLPPSTRLILSFGSTLMAHVAKYIRDLLVTRPGLSWELHAGKLSVDIKCRRLQR